MPPVESPPWVRLPLVAAQAHLLRLPDDAARGRWFLWLLQGAAGHDAAPDDPVALAGYAFGRDLLTEAAAHQQRASDQRRGAARARWSDAGAMRPHAAASVPHAAASVPHAAASVPHAAAMQTHADAMRNDAGGMRDDAHNSTEQYSTEQDKTETTAVAATACNGPESANADVSADSRDDLFAPESSHGGNADPAQNRRKAGSARDPSPADLGVLFPALLVYPEERQALSVALALYGTEAVMMTLRKLTAEAKARPRGKHRIMASELSERLRRTVALAAEDYGRAGLPVPPDTPTQADLDSMGDDQIQEVLRNA